MKITLTRKIVLISLILLAMLIAWYKHKSTDLFGVSNSSRKSQFLLKEKNNEFEIKRDHQISDGNAKNPCVVIPFKKIYDVKDINAMIKAANLIGDDEKRGQTLKRIAHLWALIDPDACLKWSLSIANDKIGYEYITAQIISTLVGNNQYEKALQLVGEIPQGDLRDTAIGYSIIDLASSHDVITADRLLNLISSKERMDRCAGTLSQTLIELGKLSELKEIYGNLSYGAMKESLGSAVVQGLMFKDPLKSLDWIRDNPELKNDGNFEALAAGFAKLDPLQGINISDEIEDPEIRKKYLSYLLSGWAGINPQEAGKWITDQISSTSFDQMKDDFFMIARKSFGHDPNLLFSQIENIKDQGEKDAATLSAVAALSEYNPRRAAELVLATVARQPEKQAEAVAITAKNWLIRDPLEASKWIGYLEGGPIKDAAVSELVTNILSKDKDIAMANSWAAQIRDPKIRAQVNKKIDKTEP